MLVDLVSWFCAPQQRGEALAERPAEAGLERQEPRGTRRVEDLNRGTPRGLAREWAPAVQAADGTLALERPPRVELILAMARH
jgi:hypothetical protein